MKRIISPALVVLFLLFLFPKERSFAREEYKFDLGSLKWEMTKGGVPKTDLGPGLPEVAILKVSNEVFEKIHASEDAALDYLQGQHIFKRKLIKVVFCDVKAYDDGNGWFLIIPHTPLSTAFIIAWQIPKNPKKMKEK
jgi:hypothetical protein